MTTDTREALAPCPPDYDICGYRDPSDTPSVAGTDSNLQKTQIAPVAGTEREALEAALKTIVCSFHRNACYPDAMDGEVDFVVQSILSTVEGAPPFVGP